jgi:3-methyladenine DNA glycosylase Mpg
VPGNVADLYFEPGLVYTFCWWQHFFDLAEYKVGGARGALLRAVRPGGA